MSSETNPNLNYTAALVGRPNAGKSLLFNALLGRNRAIVSPEAGVTRDSLRTALRLEAVPSATDLDSADPDSADSDSVPAPVWLYLVDMAGIIDEKMLNHNPLKSHPATLDYSSLDDLPPETELTALISEQILKTAQQVDILIAVFDLQEITGEEAKLLTMIRALNKPTLIVFNKTDHEKTLLEFQSEAVALKAPQAIYISAQTGYNLTELKKALSTLATKLHKQGVPPTDPQVWKPIDYTVTLVGKPNAGKSSLLNFLHKKHTAVVNAVAGTTRDWVEALVETSSLTLRFIDTAGLRRRSRKKSNLEGFSVQKTIHAIHQSDLVVLLVDAMEMLSEQDKKIAATAAHAHKPLIICINKWDLHIAEHEKTTSRESVLWSTYLQDLEYSFPLLPHFPVIKLSALTGLGAPLLIKTIAHMLGYYSKTLKTPYINTLIKEAILKPASTSEHRGRSLKIYYGVQVSTAPPVIKLFINHQSLLKDNYKRYLTNFIQQKAFTKGVPLMLLTEEKSAESSLASSPSPTGRPRSSGTRKTSTRQSSVRQSSVRQPSTRKTSTRQSSTKQSSTRKTSAPTKQKSKSPTQKPRKKSS